MLTGSCAPKRRKPAADAAVGFTDLQGPAQKRTKKSTSDRSRLEKGASGSVRPKVSRAQLVEAEN